MIKGTHNQLVNFPVDKPRLTYSFYFFLHIQIKNVFVPNIPFLKLVLCIENALV